MEKICRQISTVGFLSLASYGNKLKVYQDGSWIPSSIAKNNGRKLPVSNIRNPEFGWVHSFGGESVVFGVFTMKVLSYGDCNRIYNSLVDDYKTVVSTLLGCEHINDAIKNAYLNSMERLRFHGGTNMLYFLSDILYKTSMDVIKYSVALRKRQRYIKYVNIDGYSEEDDTYKDMFLSYVLAMESNAMGKDVTLSMIMGEDASVLTPNQFLSRYVENENKVDFLINRLYDLYEREEFDESVEMETLRNRIMDYFSKFYLNQSLDVVERLACSTFDCDYNSHIDIMFNINNDIYDLGVEYPVAPQWVEGRTYKVGDIVTFEGKTYILAKGNSDNEYSGYYSNVEGYTFFDYVYTDDFGIATSFKMNPNGIDFMHWIRSVRPRADVARKWTALTSGMDGVDNNNDDITVSAKTTSLLGGLKSWRKISSQSPDVGIIGNFFDKKGLYKKGVQFDSENILIGEVEYDDGSVRKIFRTYYNEILDIEAIDNYNDEVGHSVVIYTYAIGKCDDTKNAEIIREYFPNESVVVDNGIIYKDIYHRFKKNITGDDSMDYDYVFTQEVYDKTLGGYVDMTISDVEYTICGLNTIEHFERRNPVTGQMAYSRTDRMPADAAGKRYTSAFLGADERIMDYAHNIRLESCIGLVDNKNLSIDVNIDRGDMSIVDRHLKLGEILTLDDMIKYGNNSLNVKS